MARVLHVLAPKRAPLAPEVIRQDVAAGDEVTVALLAGAAGTDVPDGVRTRRVPDDCSYEQLVEEIFAADRVITW